MRAEIRNPAKPRFFKGEPYVLIPFALMATCVTCGIWSFAYLLSISGPQAAFVAEVGWFVMLAFGYLSLHGILGTAWISIPVLLTIEALAGFLFIPLWRFAAGDDQVDAGYTHAMLLVLIGFATFWIGSLVLKQESGLRFVPKFPDTPTRVTLISSAMLGLGVVGNLMLWKAGLFAYAADSELRASSLGIIQWLNFLVNLLPAALLVSSIEVVGKRSKDPSIRIVFWLSIFFSIGIGMISGMKSGPVGPLIIVTLVYSITNRQIPRKALLLPLLLVVFIFPFVNAYRNNLNRGYRDQFNTVSGVEATFTQSFNDAFLAYGSSSAGARAQSSREATARFSYLSYVRDIVELPSPAMLNGDERVWLAPIYPLVPRFVWKEKPVLNKGQRLSYLLGRGTESSSALTSIGDLYAMYGAYGVAVGMLVWGACLQLYMNWIGRRGTTEKSLFFYLIMLPELLNLESDSVALVAGTVQLFIIAVIMSYVIYGQTTASKKLPHNLRYSPQS
jgi:hypothetical protein